MEQTIPYNSSLIPSTMDLLLVFPRLAQRAGSFALYYMPEAIDDIAGKVFKGGNVIADATGQQTTSSRASNTSQTFVQQTGTAVLDAAIREAFNTNGREDSSILGMLYHGFSRLKSFGGFFSYLTSRWALATFTVAIVLNRTQFYASSREHLRLTWYMRLAIYMIPIVTFLVQLLHVLQAIRCQASPDFALLRYGDPLKHHAFDFGGDDGLLYKLSSTLLFWQDDMSCCAERSMSLIPFENDASQLRGSMSLLFSFFLSLCTSQFFETLACALQGRQPMPETAMTIFEHSLAFAECEAMISSAIGLGFFGLSKLDGTSLAADESAATLVTRSEILQRLNVPPEVLLVCLISCFSHLSSAILAVTGLRHKVRLVNTAIWASCYMSAFIWSFSRIILNPVENVTDLGILRFPTVCIVGFIPHILILVGIAACAIIYSLALLVTALSAPPTAAGPGFSFGRRLAWAYHNLQANVQFSSSSTIRIKMSEDFYTTLLKVGFTLLTAASEAVYLNEGNRVQVAQMTWLEKKRIDELGLAIDRRKAPVVPAELLGEGIAKGVDFTDHHNYAAGVSPYARERKSNGKKKTRDHASASDMDSGLGITQRRTRLQLTFEFIAGLAQLILTVQAHFFLVILRFLGIPLRPRWLLRAAEKSERMRKDLDEEINARPRPLQFTMIDKDGKLSLPKDNNVDVEAEMRRRWQDVGKVASEEKVTQKLYDWWKRGGWYGELDASGDYQPPAVNDDDDATSVISGVTTEHEEDDWVETDSGRITPTQRDPYGERFAAGEDAGSDAGVDIGLLSRLLNPRSQAERDEARLLSYSLQTDRPMTRSQYRQASNHDRAQVLRGLGGRINRTAAEEDEELDLEHFILEQRTKAEAKASPNGGTWEGGAEGMGIGGPSCVVCQSSPRTILAWPCGCLSACDDCRVGLAARNYTKCICCRTDVAAYSRLYVP